jgi:hypothetical protein
MLSGVLLSRNCWANTRFARSGQDGCEDGLSSLYVLMQLLFTMKIIAACAVFYWARGLNGL